MIRILAFLPILFLTVTNVQAQKGCCDNNYNAGQKNMKAGNYAEAIRFFTQGSGCGDPCNYDFAKLIQTAKQKQKKPKQEEFQDEVDSTPIVVRPSSPTHSFQEPTMVPVTGGTFSMGCTSEQQDCYDDEKPAHQVTLSDYYIGAYEVTQKQWTDIMGNNPSSFKNCDQCPVEQVSWDDVQVFLQKLNAKYPGRNYRLPTEAEWEYAARGGGKTVLFGNGKNTIDPSEINFDARDSYKKPYSVVDTYRQKTVPVGSLKSPNALGLHDMSGNVYEWCSDWKDDYPSSSQTNPAGPSKGSYRVVRGGSWSDSPQDCRVAFRGNSTPGDRYSHLGFRLARTN